MRFGSFSKAKISFAYFVWETTDVLSIGIAARVEEKLDRYVHTTKNCVYLLFVSTLDACICNPVYYSF